MTCPETTSFALTQLTEPQQYALPTALPPGFDASIALLLGNCCNLTYTQLANGTTTLSTAELQGLGSGITFTQLAGFTVSESIVAGAEIGTSGEYVTVPVGFALRGAMTSGGPAMNIIALRGTQTYNEWINDIDAVPTPFHVGNNNGNYYLNLEFAPLGLVHGGFYSLYTQGTDGAQPLKIDHDMDFKAEYTRPPGSIAEQSATLLTSSTLDAALPLYITGHSLGGALAILCAMDIGTNFPKGFPAGGLAMYNLAGPLVAAGLSAFNTSLLSVDPSVFVTAYSSAVANSYRIVNSPDIVPISPPGCVGLGSELTIQFAHVTANPVAYCAQMGSIGANHSCSSTYVPYLQQLANGFSG